MTAKDFNGHETELNEPSANRQNSDRFLTPPEGLNCQAQSTSAGDITRVPSRRTSVAASSEGSSLHLCRCNCSDGASSKSLGTKNAELELPRQVHKETIFADIAVVLVPLALLAFGLAISFQGGKNASMESIEKWRNAASVLSTLYPVIFAAILGRLMTQAARWKLEEGSSLQSLEQLLGSRTVGGAILSPFYLRCFDTLTGGLLLLWAFSPLGAQAMLRVLEPRLVERQKTADVVYFDTRSPSAFSDLSKEPEIQSSFGVNVLDMSYNSLLLTPLESKSEPVDLWGHVRIPLLSSLSSMSEPDGWYHLPGNTNIHSSLVGIPLMDIAAGNSTLRAESTYLEASCGEVQWKEIPVKSSADTKAFMEDFHQTLKVENHWSQDQDSFNISNGTFQGGSTLFGGDIQVAKNRSFHVPWSLSVDRIIDPGWADGRFSQPDVGLKTAEWAGTYADSLNMFNNETGIEAGSTEAVLQWGLSYPNHFKTYCNISQVYIETEIFCERRFPDERETCRALRQRPSKQPHPPEDITYLSIPTILDFVSKYQPQAGVSDEFLTSYEDLTLPYFFDHDLSSNTVDRVQDMSPRILSQRLTQVLNTYIHISQMGSWVTDNAPPSREAASSFAITTSSNVTNASLECHVPMVWSTLCIVSCVLLLAGGIASVAFAHLAVGPEVLGFASTAVRDNRHISVPVNVSHMDGTDMSTELKGLRLRFGVIKDAGVEKFGVGYSDEVLGVKEMRNSRQE